MTGRQDATYPVQHRANGHQTAPAEVGLSRGLRTPQVCKKLGELERENTRLKKLAAD